MDGDEYHEKTAFERNIDVGFNLSDLRTDEINKPSKLFNSQLPVEQSRI